MRTNILCSACLLVVLIIAMGCSGGGNSVMPTNNDITASTVSKPSQTHLWGYYDIYFDPSTKTIEAVPNRNVMFAANVVTFVNASPANLQFKVHGTPVGPDYVDVDIDVTIKHPFPGMNMYDGYDVRGVFIGNGSGIMKYNTKLRYARKGVTDQVMYDYNAGGYPDPDGAVGMPDGYTRWFNPVEFGVPGVLGYTPGKFATPGYTGTATLNPYKYYADGLGVKDDLWTFLTSTTNNGKFAAGSSNTRNYYLRFPNTTGVKYAYAIVANWISETTHPANGDEAMALSVAITPDIYYTSPTEKGGKLILDINVFDWNAQPSVIWIESTVLTTAYQMNATEMTPTGGTSTYSTYHVEIPANNVKSTAGNEFWVIPVTGGVDYTNTYGVPNAADKDPLAAFFRYDLYVSPTKYNIKPVVNSITDDIPPAGLNTKVYITNTAVNYSADVTDPDGPGPITATWYIEDATATAPTDPPDSMPYNWAPKALGNYKIWVKVNDGIDTVTAGPWIVTRSNTPPVVTGIIDNIPPANTLNFAVDVSATSVIYTAVCAPDPDPSPSYTYAWYIEVDTATEPTDPPDSMPFNWSTKTIGEYKIWVKVTDGPDVTQAGPYSVSLVDGWARSYGGDTSLNDLARGNFVDAAGNIYQVGMFSGTNVDFEPGPGQTLLSSFNTTAVDVCVVKYNHAGVLLWARVFGDALSDEGRGCWVDPSGNVYVSGQFTSISFDADPGSGVTMVYNAATAGGTYDNFLSKFDPDGNFLWCKTWGGTATDNNQYCWGDVNNMVIYNFGAFASASIDLDPDAGVVTRTNTQSGGGTTDPFVVRLNYSGNYLWGTSWGSTAADLISDCTPDTTGAIYCGGNFSGTCDFDPGAAVFNGTSQGSTDCYITKFSYGGAWQWTRFWGGTATDTLVPLDITGSWLYAGGTFMGVVDFDPGPGVVTRDAGSTSVQDSYIVRYDLAGNWDSTFASAFGGPVLQIGQNPGATSVGLENINDLMCDSAGGFAVAGVFGSSSIDADPGPGSAIFNNGGSWDGFTIRFNSAGQYQWCNPISGSGADVFMRIFIQHSDNDILPSGYHGTGVWDFDPGPGVFNMTALGNTDLLLIKYRSNGQWY